MINSIFSQLLQAMCEAVAALKLLEAGYPMELVALFRLVFMPIDLVLPLLVSRFVDMQRPLLAVVSAILPTCAT